MSDKQLQPVIPDSHDNLVVDWTLGTLQAHVSIVIVNC